MKEAPLVELPSGLSFRDVKVGSGPEPPVGFQVVAHYVAMTPNGKVFDSSLNRGAPYDFRIGAGQVRGWGREIEERKERKGKRERKALFFNNQLVLPTSPPQKKKKKLSFDRSSRDSTKGSRR